jgi:hypothetical protein
MTPLKRGEVRVMVENMLETNTDVSTDGLVHHQINLDWDTLTLTSIATAYEGLYEEARLDKVIIEFVPRLQCSGGAFIAYFSRDQSDTVCGDYDEGIQEQEKVVFPMMKPKKITWTPRGVEDYEFQTIGSFTKTSILFVYGSSLRLYSGAVLGTSEKVFQTYTKAWFTLRGRNI